MIAVVAWAFVGTVVIGTTAKIARFAGSLDSAVPFSSVVRFVPAVVCAVTVAASAPAAVSG
ncbi:hypothetical protein D3C85_1664980 [compost metagenome]